MEKPNLFYSKYHQTVCDSMDMLAKEDKVIFVGQQVAFQDFYGTLKNVPISKRLEMPVAEELQMGFCIGLSLEGFLPVCIYQRMDFMYRAMDSLCNHLNLLPKYSRGFYRPKVIIRTTIGNKSPLDPGIQHTQDLTEVFKKALDFPVYKVSDVDSVLGIYKEALIIDSPILIIEEQRLYV